MKQEQLDTIERMRQEISRLESANLKLAEQLYWYKSFWLRLDRLIQKHDNDSFADFVKQLFEKEN